MSSCVLLFDNVQCLGSCINVLLNLYVQLFFHINLYSILIPTTGEYDIFLFDECPANEFVVTSLLAECI